MCTYTFHVECVEREELTWDVWNVWDKWNVWDTHVEHVELRCSEWNVQDTWNMWHVWNLCAMSGIFGTCVALIHYRMAHMWI